MMIASRANVRVGARFGFALMQLGVLAASGIGLGIAIADANGDGRIIRCAGVAAGGLAVAVLVRAGTDRIAAPALGTALLVAGTAAVGDALAGSPDSAAVFGALLLTFVALGGPVARRLSAASNTAGHAGLLPARGMDVPALDLDAVATELNRARRYHRPLSVLSIDISAVGGSYLARRGAAAELASSLSVCLRQSDLLGYRGGGSLIVVLPETRADDTSRLVLRLHALLDAEISAGLRIGASSFPDEELTWVGLEGLAVERAVGIDEWIAGRSDARARVLSVVDDGVSAARSS